MSDTMRDAFEAWDCQEFCIDAEHYRQVNGVYVDAPIRNRWLTWQAAQSQLTPKETLGWMRPDELRKARNAPYLCRVHPEKDRHPDMVPVYAATALARPEARSIVYTLECVQAAIDADPSVADQLPAERPEEFDINDYITEQAPTGDQTKTVEHVMNFYYSRDGESLRHWLEKNI